MGDYGFRISQEGYDVKTADDEKMIITSKYPLLKGVLSGSGNDSITPITLNSMVVTANASTDVLSTPYEYPHGLENGQIIKFYTTGTLPSPLSINSNYYVINATTGTFKVSLTSGGSAVNITSTGSGDHLFYKTNGIKFTANASTDVITTSTAHGLSSGDRIHLSSINTLPTPLDEYSDYYVSSVISTTELKISTIKNGSDINITDTGTGYHFLFNRENQIIKISHNLDYIPIGVAYIEELGSDTWFSLPFGADSSFGSMYVKAYLDDENFNIFFDFFNAYDDSAQEVNYKYYIYLDKGKL